MAVRFTGNWTRVERFFARVKLGVFTGQSRQVADNLGHAIAGRVRNHIRSADLPWDDLAPVTIARKGHGRPYIDSLAYLRSIKVRVDRPSRFSLKIEVTPQGNHPSGMTMEELAKMLEERRPLWAPTFKEVLDMPEFEAFKKAGTTTGFG